MVQDFFHKQYCHMKVWKQGYHFQRCDLVIFMLNSRDANKFSLAQTFLTLCPSNMNCLKFKKVFFRGRGRAMITFVCNDCFNCFPSPLYCYKKQRQFIQYNSPSRQDLNKAFPGAEFMLNRQWLIVFLFFLGAGHQRADDSMGISGTLPMPTPKK